MNKFSLIAFLLVLISIFYGSCKKENQAIVDSTPKNLVIFFVNDVHGQIDNFAKVKHIVDQQRTKSSVLLVGSGDFFSGNPIVDNYPEKGFPMIDIMNKTGFDICALGNHEFDYGLPTLKNRMEQAEFEWVCANVDMENSLVPQPYDYKTLTVNDLKVTFLGLIETNGKDNAVIPSAHPWKMQGVSFERPENVAGRYSNIKAQENSDLVIVLSHLGYSGNFGDIQFIEQFTYPDLVIGGHSHQFVNSTSTTIPVFQALSNLNYLGKIEMTIGNKKIDSIHCTFYDLNSYQNYDPELKQLTNDYNASVPELYDVIGYSSQNHTAGAVGCFYVDALRAKMNVDVTFQNPGGVRAGLNLGDITKREIYEITPFNNGTVIFTMSVAEIKNFLKVSLSGFYYSGIQVSQSDNNVVIRDLNGTILSDQIIMTVGMNDYIPAVFDYCLPLNPAIQPNTDAETIIAYLQEINGEVNYTGCNRYFRFEYSY